MTTSTEALYDYAYNFFDDAAPIDKQAAMYSDSCVAIRVVKVLNLYKIQKNYFIVVLIYIT